MSEWNVPRGVDAHEGSYVVIPNANYRRRKSFLFTVLDILPPSLPGVRCRLRALEHVTVVFVAVVAYGTLGGLRVITHVLSSSSWYPAMDEASCVSPARFGEGPRRQSICCPMDCREVFAGDAMFAV